jgi:hypothetical protein
LSVATSSIGRCSNRSWAPKAAYAALGSLGSVTADDAMPAELDTQTARPPSRGLSRPAKTAEICTHQIGADHTGRKFTEIAVERTPWSRATTARGRWSPLRPGAGSAAQLRWLDQQHDDQAGAEPRRPQSTLTSGRTHTAGRAFRRTRARVPPGPAVTSSARPCGHDDGREG